MKSSFTLLALSFYIVRHAIARSEKAKFINLMDVTRFRGNWRYERLNEKRYFFAKLTDFAYPSLSRVNKSSRFSTSMARAVYCR